MKLSLKLLLVVSAIALASQSSLVLANGEAVSTSDAVPVQSDAVEADAPGADVDGDAGKECDADDCESSEETEPATPEPVVEETKEPEDPKCPSRPHIIRCAAKYLDTNQNGALERSELEAVMDSVPWLLRSEFITVISICISCGSVLRKMDFFQSSVCAFYEIALAALFYFFIVHT